MKSFITLIDVIWKQKINSFIIALITPFVKKKPLKDIIVFESHTNFDCNGGALYNFMINNGLNQKYRIIWRIRGRGKRFLSLPKNVYTVPEDRPSIRRAIAFVNARYFFSDNTMPKKPRREQVSVYCTHGGCAIKNVKGLLVVRDDVDFILSSSSNFDPLMCDNYSIPYPNNRMLHLGFPSNDILFEKHDEEILKITNKKYSHIVLWLPTFRKNENGREDSCKRNIYGIPLLENEEQFEEINKFLKKKEILLIIKLHPGHDDREKQHLPHLSNTFIIDPKMNEFQNIDVYKLMSCADALISDYSSATYSYLMRNRPIGFVLSDIDSYKPGFITGDIEKFMVGKQIYTIKDLFDFLNNVYNGVDEKYENRVELLNWLYQYKDGHACKRICEYFNFL